ncbi:hypothetical protein ACF073_23740 [Streptomyces sp. NPDC015171]|uniref:hypothetical protein n=1 Tax=Streptomyces sp. NPDC015171 TaxID=3364945 RepID=UPI0037027F8E
MTETRPDIEGDDVVEAAVLSVVSTGGVVLRGRRADPASLEAGSRVVVAETEAFTALQVLAAMAVQDGVTRSVGRAPPPAPRRLRAVEVRPGSASRLRE